MYSVWHVLKHKCALPSTFCVSADNDPYNPVGPFVWVNVAFVCAGAPTTPKSSSSTLMQTRGFFGYESWHGASKKCHCGFPKESHSRYFDFQCGWCFLACTHLCRNADEDKCKNAFGEFQIACKYRFFHILRFSGLLRIQ